MPLIKLAKKKISSEVFFLLLNIFTSISLASAYLWSVQSNIITSANHELIYLITFSLIIIIYRPKVSIGTAAYIITLLFLIQILNTGFNEEFFYFAAVSTVVYVSYEFGKNKSCCSIDNKLPIDSIISNSFVIASFATSLIIFYQYLTPADSLLNNIWTLPKTSNRLSGNIGQPNHASTLISIGMFLMILKNGNGNIKKSKTIALFTIISFLSIATFLTGSRTGILILATLPFISRFSSSKSKIYALAWLPILLVAIVLPATQYAATILFNSTETEINRGFSSGRFLIYQIAFDIIKESPWIGYGFDRGAEISYSILDRFPNYKEKSLLSSFHNILLDFSIAFGIPATFLLLFILFRKLWNVRHEFRNADKTIAIACLTPITIHSLLENPLGFIYFLIPFGLMMGILLTPHKSKNQSTGKIFKANYFFPPVVLTISFLSFNEYQELEVDFKKLRLQNNGIELKNPYTWRDDCYINKYCDFLNIHTIDDKTLKNNKRHLDLSLKMHKKMPTPHTLYLGFKANEIVGDSTEMERISKKQAILFSRN